MILVLRMVRLNLSGYLGFDPPGQHACVKASDHRRSASVMPGVPAWVNGGARAVYPPLIHVKAVAICPPMLEEQEAAQNPPPPAYVP
jgi:hypothetical protein